MVHVVQCRGGRGGERWVRGSVEGAVDVGGVDGGGVMYFGLLPRGGKGEVTKVTCPPGTGETRNQ